MRKRVRLSGREQIDRTAFSFTFREENGIPVEFTLSLLNSFVNFPAESNVKVRLIESRQLETVSLGTLEDARQGPVTQDFKNTKFFVNPTCELRISGVSRVSGAIAGKILGSTGSWKLRVPEGRAPNTGLRGILAFACGDTDPLPWDLEFFDDWCPVLRLDRKIPQSSVWAVRDHVFFTCVLPGVIRLVLQKILDSGRDGWEEKKWIQDWLVWVEELRPGVFAQGRTDKPLIFEDDFEAEMWIHGLVGEFSRSQNLLERLVGSMADREELES